MQRRPHNVIRWWICIISLLAITCPCFADDPWIVFPGGEGPGAGKHIVLVSGDEEYRSEEALAQLGKILSTRHGFHCTVLFAVDPETGIIDPNNQNNIPGLAALKDADLMVIFTRFRALPDDQMQHIDDYLRRGGPVLGIRTATHAFRFKANDKWAHYGNGYKGDKEAWVDGFGRLVLGEKWISHHGRHKDESTLGVIATGAEDHPVARGLADEQIWGPTDVYGVRLPLPGDSKPIVLGKVMLRPGERDNDDPLYGMRPEDGPPATGEKNDPMMPIAWTKSYKIPGGKKGRAFTSTLGASTDLLSAGARRLLINGAYWCLGMEKQIPAMGTNVDLVGSYEPTAYSGKPGTYWADRKLKPADMK